MSRCPVPDAVSDVVTRHGTTRVYRFGVDDGRPVVLLPALMATVACYGPVIPALAEHRPVYAVDTLGEAGRSVQTAPFAATPDRARCLDEVLAHLGLTAVHLVGASTGGWHAVNQAIHAPDRLASISVLDPTTVTTGFSWPVICYGAVTAVFDRTWLWRRFLRWSAGQDILDRPDAQLVLAGIRDYKPKVPFQAPPADDDLRAIPVPVLALFGGRSVVHDAGRAADRLRALLPQADVETLPDTGHYVFLRPADRERIVHRVIDFVGRVDRERR
ncbi:alpha/beta fold hydrolase [Actinophytocola xanthii]|nr:alpha/beta hydrolase [Actinophytocola xanthii]